MAVPYVFGSTPGGSSIPLSHLDDNFAYIETQIANIPLLPEKIVNSASALYSEPVSDDFNMQVNGYYSDGDGGGGLFYAGPYVANANFTGRMFYTGRANSSPGDIFNNTNTITVNDGSIFYVGMNTTINGTDSGSITNISGNVITLSSTWAGGSLVDAVFAGYSSTGGAQLTMIVSSAASGIILPGMKIIGPGITEPLFVAQFLSGVFGGAGVYEILGGDLTPKDITVASASLTGVYYSSDGGMTFVPNGGDGTRAWLRAGVILSPGREKRYFNNQINVKWFGAIGDQTKRTLNTYYSTLAQAQAIFPFATNIATETVDWAGIQAAINWAEGYYNRQFSVWIPSGGYMTSHPILINSLFGGRINGQRFVNVYDGAYISYDGDFWALFIRSRYYKEVFTTATLTGSTAVVTVGSTAGMYVGMNCKIDGSGFSFIKSIDSPTQLTLNDVYGPPLTNVPFEAFNYAYTYSGILREFGVICSQPCPGAIYGKMLNQYAFEYIIPQGIGGAAIYPNTNFGCQYGFYLDDFALSYITYCWPSFFFTAIYAEGGEIWIQDCNIFAMSTGIQTGTGNFFIENNYFEWFDNAILLTTTGPYAKGIFTTGSVVRDNVFGANTPSVAKRALQVFDVFGTDVINIESLTIAGNTFKGWNGGAAQSAISFNINNSNPLVKVTTDIHDNSFHAVTLAGITSNDPRVVITQYGNVSYDDLGFFANVVSNVYTTFSGYSGSFLTGSYSLWRSNFFINSPLNTSENVLTTFIVPPNVIGKNGSLRITTNWFATTNANAKNIYIKLTNTSGTIITQANLANSFGGKIISEIFCTNSLTAQTTNFSALINAAPVEYGAGSLAANFGAPVTIAITAQKAVGSDEVTLQSALVEILPA